MEHGGAAVKDDGVVFLAVDVDDLFAFRDGRERLQCDAELFKSGVGGVQLAEAAVDEDERGKGFLLCLKFAVTACEDLVHRGEVVYARDAVDLELAIVGLLHLAVFPYDHGGDGLSALDVRDVEALDAFWRVGEAERILQGCGDGGFARLQGTEALIVRLLGVLADEIDQRAFFSALRCEDLYLVAGAVAEERGEEVAVAELEVHHDGAGNIWLI